MHRVGFCSARMGQWFVPASKNTKNPSSGFFVFFATCAIEKDAPLIYNSGTEVTRYEKIAARDTKY
jgi:hypothetical protein